jgi:serine/threonine protein kinase
VASLDECFPKNGHEKLYKGPMPSHEQFFFQLATGLQYIHGQNLVHGAIKPSNILVHSSHNPQIKISEFGFTPSRWNKNTSSYSGFLSDNYWIAPELTHAHLLRRENSKSAFKATQKSDVFAAGKVFFYYYSQFYIGISDCYLPNNALNGNEENLFSKFLNHLLHRIKLKM